MRILIATKHLSINPYIAQLRDALAENGQTTEVTWGLEAFWEGPLEADIVHIHWPNALFDWIEPDEAGLSRLEARLKAWSACARIVVTVHDRFPHYRKTPMYVRLFELVYSFSQGFIHLGHQSIDEFRQSYPHLADRPIAVIPIGAVDTYFKNDGSMLEARRWLGISPDAYVCLSFGYLRDYEETRFLLDSFRAVQMPDKFLVIAGNYIALSDQRAVRIVRRLRIQLNPRMLFHRRRVPDDEVQYYVNAANVVLIPRVQILNSSNIALAFSFGKVVVGPEDGNVSEILKATGNPAFTPGDPASMAAAIEAARGLEADGKGGQNYRYALDHWNWPALAEQHVAFFRRILDLPSS